MIDWERAAPLIGVIVTAFVGLIGAIIAHGRRESGVAPGASVVPTAIAGAIAERGLAEGLTLAVGALTAQIVAYATREDEWRDEDRDEAARRHRTEVDESARKHREVMDALARLTLAVERIAR